MKRQFGLWTVLLLALTGCDDGSTEAEPADMALADVSLADGAVQADMDTADAAAAPDAAEPEADASEPDAAVPDAAVPVDDLERFSTNGPSRVGFSEDEVTYTPNGWDEPRTLRVVYWYPTTATSGPTAVYASLKRRNEVFQDAPIDLDGPTPIFVFSHGSGGVAEQTFTLMERFASHGWLVVAMDHTGNTSFDMSLRQANLFDLRPQDVSRVIDHVLDLPEAHRFSGLPDGDRIFLAGHSFGGYTTLAMTGAAYDLELIAAECDRYDVCDYVEDTRELIEDGFNDPRIKAAAPITPAGYILWGDAGLEAIEVPTLLITAALDETLPDDEEGTPIWGGLDQPANRRMQFLNAGHFSFTDFCFVLAVGGITDGCGDQYTPNETVIALSGAYMMAWAHRYVLDDADAGADFLDTEESPEPEIFQYFIGE